MLRSSKKSKGFRSLIEREGLGDNGFDAVRLESANQVQKHLAAAVGNAPDGDVLEDQRDLVGYRRMLSRRAPDHRNAPDDTGIDCPSESWPPVSMTTSAPELSVRLMS